MTANAARIHFPLKILSTEDVSVALADEGVPVRAIARATQVDSSDVYDTLRDAVSQGKLIALPSGDWPPGTPRHLRQPAGQSVLNLADTLLRLACSKVFGMTRLQAAVFVAILRRPEVTKDQVHNTIEEMRRLRNDPTDPKMVDVVICHIRKKIAPTKGANPSDIILKTLWGQGYALEAHERDKALTRLTDHFNGEQAHGQSNP